MSRRILAWSFALSIGCVGGCAGAGDPPGATSGDDASSRFDAGADARDDTTDTTAPPGRDGGSIFDATDDAHAKDAADDAPKPPPLDVVQIDATSGWQIFPGGGYRYGPSIVVEDDGSIEMFTCSPGSAGAWDYVRWRHSTDGGHTWSPDAIAVQPTPGTRDAFSACDPGAIKIGAYWYVGYTSTENPKGLQNHLYLARASSPGGPYEKWDGKGFGGAPQPIVTYTGDAAYYGVGEPSLVWNGKLYVYYTWADATGGHTDLSIVDDPTAPDWPAHLVSKGHVIERRPNAEDSTDVKYVDALGRFVGVSTYDRFSPNATLGVYQSFDGIAWEPAPFRGARVQPGAHNAGISGDARGHLDPSKPSFVAYAYQPPGKSWGDWPTFVDPITVRAVPFGAPVGGGVSSIVGGATGDWSWSGPRGWDGDEGTIVSSDGHGPTDVAEEWAFVDLGKPLPVKGLTIVPRGGGLGFPVDFSIQSGSPAGWTDVPGEAQVGFARPSGKVVRTFAAPVTTRYLRVHATRLGADDVGNHYLQLGELEPSL